MQKDKVLRVFSHGWAAPEMYIRRGVRTAPTARLRRVANDLLAGRETHVTVVGGSITYGDPGAIPGVTDWFSVFSQWLSRAFPDAKVVARNGAVPGEVGDVRGAAQHVAWVVQPCVSRAPLGQ